jgi:tRNA-splicing ligase RtcB
MARAQLETVGSGNHYVDIFEDDEHRIWVGVHFRSRGFGHKIATRFLNRAGAKDDMDSAPGALDSRTQEGQDYIVAMKLAGRYAYARINRAARASGINTTADLSPSRT